jgi:hypothetical protein
MDRKLLNIIFNLKSIKFNFIIGIFISTFGGCGFSSKPIYTDTDYKKIIGTPVKIANLEIAQYDFPEKLNWNDANVVCNALGDGWRLPTEDELNFINKNKRKIGNFSNSHYWSNTVVVCFNTWHTTLFSPPNLLNDKESKNTVRALRSF